MMRIVLLEARLEAALKHLDAITAIVKLYAEDKGASSVTVPLGLDHIAKVKLYLNAIPKEL